jgi:tetratricopeptide (TPR) repeat protein
MKTQRTITVPAGWDKAACGLWEQGRRVEAIQACLAAFNKAPMKDPRLTLQVAYYLFLINDYRGAATILERQLAATPDHFETLLNLSVCYSRTGRCAESVELSQRALAQQPENYTALDGLASCLYRLGRYDESADAGTRVLELKNRLCDASAAKGWALPAGHQKDVAEAPGKRHVISYSLWGDKPTYLRGSLRNLLLGQDIYPGWTLRFNLDASVPAEFIDLIRQLGGEVVMHPASQSQREKLCWRFKVANDPSVGYFLVRDVDSPLNLREAQAVQAWRTSDKWFHVMHDWWTHTDLILAGMWGGVAGVLPDLSQMLMNYQSRTAETPNIDQWFLRDRVWAYVRQSCLNHDRCFTANGAQPFPGPILADDLHIGQDEYAAHGQRQERQLRAWIEKYPCLGPLRWNR